MKAIKANYLDETRNLIKKAEDMDADDEAPVTLAKAKSLIEKTAKELEQNRTDMIPTILAIWRSRLNTKRDMQFI